MLSAAIVFTIAVAVAAYVNRDLIRIKIASIYVKVPPKPGEGHTMTPGTAPPLQGDAPWALSALPECLIQTSESTGPKAYVLAHLPPASQPVGPSAALSYGDCTISVAGDEAYVRRGNDRFHIPPPVIFYRSSGTLSLVRIDPKGGTELRVYEPSSQP